MPTSPSQPKSVNQDDIRALFKEAALQIEVKAAQRAYLHQYWLITVPSAVAYKVGIWIGLPLFAFGLFTGQATASDAGLFLFLLGIVLQIAVAIAVLPGVYRVTKAVYAKKSIKEPSDIDN